MLTLVCGLPRAGKTTYSSQFENVVHLDDYLYLPLTLRHERCNRNAETEDDVVVEGIYHTAKLRISLIQAYRGKGLKCVWLDTPLEIKKHRIGYVPAMSPFPFEPPTLDEGWDEIIIIRGNDEQRYSR